MTATSVTSLGTYLNNINTMHAEQAQLQVLSYQVDNGTKAADLQSYGNQAGQLLSLKTQLTGEQNYVTTNNVVNTTLAAQGTALNQLSTDASTLQGALAAINGNSTTVNLATLQSVVNGLLTEIPATLNSQAGNQYIFGGTRYSTAPVADLSQVAAPTTPSAFTAATNPTLPGYDSQAPGSSASSYTQQTAQLSSDSTMSYGVSSNDPAIQKLVYALQQAQGACSSTGTTQQQFLQNAIGALSDTDTSTGAISGLSGLEDLTSQKQVTVAASTSLHTAVENTLQTQVDNIQNVDSATAATELSTLQNQLQASYKVTSTMLNLTILDYLK